MKIENGKLIYLFISTFLIFLLFLPNSLNTFDLSLIDLIEQVEYKKINLSKVIVDITSIITLIFGYVILNIIYDKNSKYRKFYLIFVIIVLCIWTICISLRS